MKNILIWTVAGGLLALGGCNKETAPAPTAAEKTSQSALERLMEAYSTAGGPDLKTKAGEVQPWLVAHPDVAEQLVPKCLEMRAETQGSQFGKPAETLCVLATVVTGNRAIDEKLKNHDQLSFGGKN